MICPVCREEADFASEHNLIICTHCRSVLLGVDASEATAADWWEQRNPIREAAFESLCDEIDHHLEDQRAVAWLIYSLNHECFSVGWVRPSDPDMKAYLVECNRPFAQYTVEVV